MAPLAAVKTLTTRLPLHWVHNNVSPGSPCLTVAPFLHTPQAHSTISCNTNLAYSNTYSLVYLSKVPPMGQGITCLGLNTGSKLWIFNNFLHIDCLITSKYHPLDTT